MASLNRVTIIGNLGRDPEIRTVGSNKVANFSVAASESWKDKGTGEKKERTEWVNVVVWNEQLVKIVEQYVKKGNQIYIEGKLQTRKWEKDGVERYSTEVVLNGFDARILLLGGRQDSSSSDSRQESKPATAQQSYAADLDDEVPF